MTQYSNKSHTVYYHRYHIVWITKYRYKVLTYDIKKRVREIIAVVAGELNIKIENGVISSDHIHIFANIPPHIKVSEFVQKAKGRSSKKIQEEFPILRKKYWGRHLWARGYFSSTSGNVTDDMINEYINRHTDAHEPAMTTNIRLE
ncbi:IS200/IS605 family transposase [Rickettsia endosymbiont of Pantilius tunicatus]|uniref:IS200/IS605 family transposase n=1 Tax=Rickettsia endosymbiont of Pantilius tunicatus TaxID=3066267 RepID=UPI00376F39C8